MKLLLKSRFHSTLASVYVEIDDDGFFYLSPTQAKRVGKKLCGMKCACRMPFSVVSPSGYCCGKVQKE